MKKLLLVLLLCVPAFAEFSLGGGAPTWKAAVANSAALPASGNSTNDCRVAQATTALYCWSGSAWVQQGGSSGVAWGAITGTLSDQTDLQTALNLTAPLASPTFTGTIGTPLSSSRAMATDGSGNLAVATTTSTELGYVHGVTSAIQTQLGLLAPLASPTFTGTVTFPSTSQNFAFIGPTSGSGVPTFRALVAGDIPSLSYAPTASPTFTGTVTAPIVTSGTANPASTAVLRFGKTDTAFCFRNNANSTDVGCLNLSSADKPTFSGNFGFGGTTSAGYTFGAGTNDLFFNSLGTGGTLSSIGNATNTYGFYEGPGLVTQSDGVGYIGEDLGANLMRPSGILTKNFFAQGDNSRCFGVPSVQTTNGTATKLWQNVNFLNSPTDNNDTTAYSWEGFVTARASVGTGTPAWSTFKVYGQTHREGGACVLDFSTAAPHLDSNSTLAAATVAWTCDGSSVNRTDLTVTGLASTTIDWTAYLCWNKAQ